MEFAAINFDLNDVSKMVYLISALKPEDWPEHLHPLIYKCKASIRDNPDGTIDTSFGLRLDPTADVVKDWNSIPVDAPDPNTDKHSAWR